MLTTLCIEHFAVVKHLELDFKRGMTAFTGETGAGKSIMIDALMLALGGRADASAVRPGEGQCDITAGFYFEPNSKPARWLQEHEIQSEEGELYLRRIVYAEGRSKSYINGQPFPLQKVKELAEQLVLIHGQHQHLTLMQHSTHREQLDHYAKLQTLLIEVGSQFQRCQRIQQDIDRLKTQKLPSDRIQLLGFLLEELSALNLQEGEIQALNEEHQLLHHAQKYLQHSQEAIRLLSAEEQPNICSRLNQVLQLINQLPQEHPQLKASQELINSALIQCEEAVDELERFAERIPMDQDRLHAVEARMSTIHALARKNQVEPSQLLQLGTGLQKELEHLLDSEQYLCRLESEYLEALKIYEECALKLRAARQAHAPQLAQEITDRMQQLGMPKGWIEIELTPLEKMQLHGLDKVEYTVCTNPGMEPDSLHKIASGGELSRIGLAIQLITAQQGATPTLLFDEVDVGISGATAALVGQMLRQLGEQLQIFCVTHQAQVASYAHNHYQVSKQSDDHQTQIHMTLLNPTEKINEIARMLGGLTITEQTRSHAKELLIQST